jgi:quercetin dioxygenase-like cupin family protein
MAVVPIIPAAISYFGFTCAVHEGVTGQGVPLHSHSNQHGLYVLSGTLLVRVESLEDRQITSEQGLVYLPPMLPHELEIVSDNAQFVTVFAS